MNMTARMWSGALALGLICSGTLALADNNETPVTQKRPAKAVGGKTADSVPADDTAKNQKALPTADQASNAKSDVDLTAQIRRSVMADKGLSMSAHNVKIIAQSGVVTLKGPVKSAAEKMTVEKKAGEVVGMKNVRNELEIAP